MKYYSQIDFKRIFTLIFIIIVFAFSIYSFSISKSIFSAVSIIVWIFIIYKTVNVFYSTFYELQDDYIALQQGTKRLEIKYIYIVSASLTKDVDNVFGLSDKAVKLKLINRESISISPKNRESFMEELSKKNQNILIKQ